METHILTTVASHLNNKVGAGDKIAQLAEFLCEDRTVVKVFRLAENEVQPVESPLQAKVATDDADIVPHEFLQLALSLGD